jgi:hypothetical protein
MVFDQRLEVYWDLRHGRPCRLLSLAMVDLEVEEVETVLHASEGRSNTVHQADDRLGDRFVGMAMEHDQTRHADCTPEAKLRVRDMPLGPIL